MAEAVPVLDLAVDLATEASRRQGAARVLAAVRPAWPQQAVRWKVHTDGITNKLVGGWVEGRREDTVTKERQLEDRGSKEVDRLRAMLIEERRLKRDAFAKIRKLRAEVAEGGGML